MTDEGFGLMNPLKLLSLGLKPEIGVCIPFGVETRLGTWVVLPPYFLFPGELLKNTFPFPQLPAGLNVPIVLVLKAAGD